MVSRCTGIQTARWSATNRVVAENFESLNVLLVGSNGWPRPRGMCETVGLFTNSLLVGAFLLLLLRLCLSRRRNNQPPGPRGLPLLGYLPFIGSHPAKTYFELSKTYGPVISIQLGPQNVIVLNDYDTIQEALVKQSDAFSGRPQSEFIDKVTGGYGVVFRNFDDDYKIQRKFTITTLRGLGFGKRSMESKILEEIEHLCHEISSTNGNPFNCQGAFAAAASNVACNVMLGSRFSYDDEYFKGMVRIVCQQFSDKVNAFCISLLFIAPWLRYIPPFSKAYKRMLDDIDFVVGILQRNLDEHKKSLDPENPRDFIDEYLTQMQTTSNTSFCEKQLFQIVRDIFVAGTETTSSALRWAVLIFANRQDIQEKVFNEVKSVIGDGVPSMKVKDEMPYVNAFIHELMRHRTLAPLAVPHATTKQVSFKGYTIAKEQTVLPNLWAVHHDPANFENPSEFHPERFINKDGKFVSNSKVMPFSIGPRYCLGEQLARMELFLYLVSIVQRYEICADSSFPLPKIDEGHSGVTEVPKTFSVSFKARE